MLGVIGLVAVIVGAYFAYKTANDNGRSGPLWAFITIAIGLGFQLVIPVLIGMVIGIVYVASGTPVDELQDKITGPTLVIGIIAIVSSFVGIGLVLRHVSKLPEDDPAENLPPPPTFTENE